MPIFVLSLIMVILGGGLFVDSQSSLPGDLLFPIKIFSENARAALVQNSEEKIIIHIAFAEKRIEEINDLLAKNGNNLKSLKIAAAKIRSHILKTDYLLEQNRNRFGYNTELTHRINLEIRANELALKLQADKLKEKERDLSLAILEASKKDDSGKIDRLLAERKKVTDLKGIFETEFGSADNVFGRIDAAYGIKEAEAKRKRLISKLEAQGIIIPADKLDEIENRIALANYAFSTGRFWEAANHVFYAQNAIRLIDEDFINHINPLGSSP